MPVDQPAAGTRSPRCALWALREVYFPAPIAVVHRESPRKVEQAAVGNADLGCLSFQLAVISCPEDNYSDLQSDVAASKSRLLASIRFQFSSVKPSTRVGRPDASLASARSMLRSSGRRLLPMLPAAGLSLIHTGQEYKVINRQYPRHRRRMCL
jgi:hypothetical protein